KRANVADGRALDVVVAEGGYLARLLRRRRHGFGLGEARRHRLFAPQMLAGLEYGDGHFRMELVGRGQRDDIDIRVVDDGAPVAGRLGEAELAGLAPGEVLIDLAE